MRRRTGNRTLKLLSADVLHLANSSRRLVVDHVAFVLQVPLNELVHRPLHAVERLISKKEEGAELEETELGVFLHNLRSVTDEHADGKGALERSSRSFRTRELLNHLRDGHAVALADEVEKTESVVLDDGARTSRRRVTLAVLRSVAALVLDSLSGFVRPTLDHVLRNGVEVVRGNEGGGGDGSVAVDNGGLEETLDTDDHGSLGV
jgi:hypothetical protein